MRGARSPRRYWHRGRSARPARARRSPCREELAGGLKRQGAAIPADLEIVTVQRFLIAEQSGDVDRAAALDNALRHTCADSGTSARAGLRHQDLDCTRWQRNGKKPGSHCNDDSSALRSSGKRRQHGAHRFHTRRLTLEQSKDPSPQLFPPSQEDFETRNGEGFQLVSSTDSRDFESRFESFSSEHSTICTCAALVLVVLAIVRGGGRAWERDQVAACERRDRDLKWTAAYSAAVVTRSRSRPSSREIDDVQTTDDAFALVDNASQALLFTQRVGRGAVAAISRWRRAARFACGSRHARGERLPARPRRHLRRTRDRAAASGGVRHRAAPRDRLLRRTA